MACRLEDDINLGLQLNGLIDYNYLCSEEQSYLQVEIIEGVPNYSTHILGIDNDYDVTLIHENDLIHYGIPIGDYLITVSDSMGSSFQEALTIEPSFTNSPNFGPVPPLSSSQPTVLLDATQVFGTNPNYSYSWFHENELLSNTTSELLVDTPGLYTVIVVDTESDCEMEASIVIEYILEVTIETNVSCSSNLNYLNILIDFGYSGYYTTIEGSLGSSYTFTHGGDYTISDLDFDEYLITVTDQNGDGEVYQELIDYTSSGFNLDLDIYSQLIDICENCSGSACQLGTTQCPNNIPFFDAPCPSLTNFTLDASVLIQNNPNVVYEWYIWDELISNSPQISFEYSGRCSIDYLNNNACNNNYVYTVVVSDPLTGCSTSQIFATKAWCPILIENPTPKEYNSLIYPNPGNTEVTFYYEVSSNLNFGGTVEVFSVTGQLIYSNSIDGNNQFTLPYSISTSGTYFIRTTTTDGTVLVDRVIIK
ncbi:T9SS type A sorting domain-containing protein [uncultured Planktosalinus sp.]|uniref:T9SS type A sorting domain-containing protein n=1 Tax=uncultured Planktosalinus sp. TaxID=1810935 RepID=UPI0030D81B5D